MTVIPYMITTRYRRLCHELQEHGLQALCLLILCLATLPAQAVVEVDGLYQVEKPVSSQNASERTRAMSAALVEVLVRMAGRDPISSQPSLTRALATAGRYVQQYNYFESEVVDQAGQLQPQLMLRMIFDADRLRTLLEQSGLAVWGKARPVTLLWLALEQGGRRYILADGQQSEARSMVELEARRRGVPLLLPLMDLEDQSTVQLADVWGGFDDSVRKASRRYGADSVVVGRLWRDRSGGWAGRWSLYLPDQDLHWQVASTQLKTALGDGIDGMADTMISRYALLLGDAEAQAVDIVVSPVTGLDSYARLGSMLSQLDPVTDVELVSMQADQVRYRLTVRGGPRILVQSLSISTLLTPATTPAAIEIPAPDAPLRYQYTP